MCVYLEAAKLVGEGREHWSCWAIWQSAGKPGWHYSESPEVRRYAALFSPQGSEYGCWSFSMGEPPGCKELKNQRIVALCLMSAIAASEGNVQGNVK